MTPCISGTIPAFDKIMLEIRSLSDLAPGTHFAHMLGDSSNVPESFLLLIFQATSTTQRTNDVKLALLVGF